MALVSELLDQLKIELKRAGFTYKMVANELSLSESSVKRLFRDKDMSLSRLESICTLINLDISSLVLKSDEQSRQLTQLTHAQEKSLVSDERLFLLVVHLVYGWSFNLILEHFDLDRHEAQQHLTKLDKMQIIELLPGNRIRVLLSPQFEWIKGGPIHNYFEDYLQGNFFESSFTAQGELRLVANAWVSMNHIEAFHENMRKLVREFELHKEFDKHSPVEKRLGTSLVLAIRPWKIDVFEKYKRN